MTHVLAIVLYRCELDGVPTESLDLQVRYFADDGRNVEQVLRQEATAAYKNQDGIMVSWPFVRVLACEPFGTPRDGEEVVGVIAGCGDFPRWAKFGDTEVGE